MLSNENFEEYLKAIDVNTVVRKIASRLKPDKEIIQVGNHMIIKTLNSFKNYIIDFEIGTEFEEDLTGVDGHKCMTCVTWDGDKLLCVQKGEKEDCGWSQWIEGNEMHLLLSESLQLLSEAGFPTEFACQKITKGDQMTLEHNNGHKYELVAKHLNFDHMIMGMVQR